jgi:hypothetical protein
MCQNGLVVTSGNHYSILQENDHHHVYIGPFFGPCKLHVDNVWKMITGMQHGGCE